MSLGLLKDLAQIFSYVFGAIAGFSAFLIYRRNARLERVRWASNLYAKFYETESPLKKIREQLDCAAPNESVYTLVKSEAPEFTDYLNFFELMAYLKNSKQLKEDDIEALFGYYLDCISKHRSVVEYIGERRKGYRALREYLGQRTSKTA